VSIVGWWHPLIATLRLALANEAYTHILLILPLSVALIYLDREHLKRDAARLISQGRPAAGWAVLVCAVLLAGVARWGLPNVASDEQLSLNMFALVLWWIGSIMFCFGIPALRAFLFPLCFLFWMVPAPAFLLDRVVQFLQYQSAFASRILFHAIGVPVTQDGILLSIPSLDIEVARECSSIRSSLLLIIITMVLSHLFLRSWWRKALLIAAAIPLSVAKNGLRIVTIGELGTRVDRGFLDGRLHHHGGIVFLGIAVVAAVALLWILHRTEVQRNRSLELPC
jgi:exosortase